MTGEHLSRPHSANSKVWHGFTNMRRFLRSPLTIVAADGCYVTDEHGNRYLNAFSSLMNLNLGGGQQDIVKRISDQATALPYFPIERATHQPAEEYARRLTELTPAGLDYVFYASTGSEANESIIKIIRQHQRLKHGATTRKIGIIALDRGYHGITLGALSATGTAFTQWREQFAPLLPGFHHVPAPYSYRCPFFCAGSCDLSCARAVRTKIEEVGPENLAGIMVEPVLGVGGVLAPPREYHLYLRELCREFDLILAFDEVVTGFGRLGEWFAAHYYDVAPDLMALSKGINGGYLPFGAVAVSSGIYDTFAEHDNGFFANGSTTNGHPVCCASALATLDALQGGVIDQAREQGAYLFKRFRELSDNAIVGEIRGIGLLMGIELVADPRSRKPLPQEQWDIILGRLASSGLIIGSSNSDMGATVLGIAPPLTVLGEEIDDIYRIVSSTIQRYSRFLS
jgi:adenosylmethionine-8-amino-7-oxononanoate aminotransferase